MNIIEAVKSGKRFRRKSMNEFNYWCISNGDSFFWIDKHGNEHICNFSPEQIVSDDWEIECIDIKIKDMINYLIKVGLTPDQYRKEYFK